MDTSSCEPVLGVLPWKLQESAGELRGGIGHFPGDHLDRKQFLGLCLEFQLGQGGLVVLPLGS